jgi:hypothetical protein
MILENENILIDLYHVIFPFDKDRKEMSPVFLATRDLQSTHSMISEKMWNSPPLLNLVSDSQFSTNPIQRPGTEFFQFR